MAITSFGAFLMKGTGTGTITYSKLVDIKAFPDLGGTPEMLQTTTLSDSGHTYIPGIDNAEAMEFTANFNKADYATLSALKGQKIKYAVWFGCTESEGTVTPTGSEGKFEFDGYLTVHASGAGVNEVVEMVISIAPASAINFSSVSG